MTSDNDPIISCFARAKNPNLAHGRQTRARGAIDRIAAQFDRHQRAIRGRQLDQRGRARRAHLIAVQIDPRNAHVGLQLCGHRRSARVTDLIAAEIDRRDSRVGGQRGSQRGDGRIAQTLVGEVEIALHGGQLGANVATETQRDREGQIARRARGGGLEVGIALQ